MWDGFENIALISLISLISKQANQMKVFPMQRQPPNPATSTAVMLRSPQAHCPIQP